jgi:hypothetical protein
MRTAEVQKEINVRRSNSKITLTGKKAIKALQEVEFMMISLRNIENHYLYKDLDSCEQDPEESPREITRFIRQNNFIQRLCTVRRIISEKFDNTLGKDDMDDTERAMEHIKYWQKPGD